MFASWIPEITELAAQRNKYGGKYNKDVRKRYTGRKDVPKWLNIFFCLILFGFESFRLYDFVYTTTNLYAIYYAKEWQQKSIFLINMALAKSELRSKLLWF